MPCSAAERNGHNNGKTFNVIHNELAVRDYSIRYIIADACDYGIPQHRTRTYVVAFKSQIACDNFKFPDKCILEKQIFDIIDKTIKVDEAYYLKTDSYQYRKLSEFIKDDEQSPAIDHRQNFRIINDRTGGMLRLNILK